MLAPSFEEEVARYHLAVPEITRGDPGPVKDLYSRLDDVTLANPFGGIARGWAQVEARLDQASRQFQDGEMLGFDTITSYTARDTAYLVETEHFRARLEGTGSWSTGTPTRRHARSPGGPWRRPRVNRPGTDTLPGLLAGTLAFSRGRGHT